MKNGDLLRRTGASLLAGILLTGQIGAVGASREQEDSLPPHDGYLVRLKDSRNASVLGLEGEQDGVIVVKTAQEASRIDPRSVAYVEPNYIVEAFPVSTMGEMGGLGGIRPPNTPNDPCYQEYQWNLHAIEAYSAYRSGLTGRGVRVGFVDSGVNADHEDLKNACISGQNFVEDEWTYSDDTYGHGTFTMGIAAAQTNNGVGLAGIAPNMELRAYRVFASKTTTISAIVSALDQAVADGCRVINLSLGTPMISQVFRESVDRAVGAGCILVAAVGNTGGGSIQYPAGYDGVIGVGSVDADLGCSDFSQRNDTVDFVAPGGGVPSLSNTNDKAYMLDLTSRTNMGTSFAAPVVTAMAALALEYDDGLTAESVSKLLQMSAVDMGAPGRDKEYGDGLVNVKNLLEVLRKDYPIVWDLNGAPEQEGLPAGYSIKNKPALPESLQWEGHSFAGWYLTPDCTGQAVAAIPAEAVGELTLYAGWQEDRATAVSEVMVDGYAAEMQDDGSFLVCLPYGADLTAVTAEQITVLPVLETSQAGKAVRQEDGSFVFSVTSNAPQISRAYTLRLENAVFHPKADSLVQTGTAVPASLDGDTKAIPFELSGETLLGWFENGDGTAALPEDFTVTAELVEGAGELLQAGLENPLSYTPDSMDAGKTVTIALRGRGTAGERVQLTPDTVTLRISVGLLPPSTPVMLSSGLFFDRAVQTQVELFLKLYGSKISCVAVGDKTLTEEEYHIGKVTTDGSDTLLLEGSALGTLPAPADYTIELRFEGMETRLFTQLKLQDSKPVAPDPDPTPSTSPDVTPSPDSSPSPDVTPSPDPSPSPDVTPNPDPEPSTSPDPAPSPSPDPTPDPEPAPDPGPGPSFGGGFGGVPPVVQFPVSAEPAENGVLSVSSETAVPGKTVTIRVKPDKGYYLEELSVTDESGNQVGLVKETEEKYTFVMPEAGVRAAAVFRPIIPPFEDVSLEDYYFDAVNWAAGSCITAGMGDGLFGPEVTCTRAQIVTFLWNAAGKPQTSGQKNPFLDVTEADWYYQAVLWAAEQGITTGISPREFGPGLLCTRAQAVTFLWKYLGRPAAEVEIPFTDAAETDWYYQAVKWAVEHKITSGTSETAFSPEDHCTRAQIVTFLYRALDQ